MSKSKNQLMSVYPEELVNKSVAFFSLGDKEVQDRWFIANINDVLDKLTLYLKVKTLLYDVVLHSTSFYIESDLSRSLYTRNDILPLFSSISSPVSANLFVLSDEADTFYEHVEKKRRMTPKSFTAYHSGEVRQRILEMRSFKSVFRRSLGIGDIIARLWTEDLKKVEDNASIAHMIEASNEPSLEAKYKNLFYSIVKDRGEMQLSPEYVSERLRRESVPLKLAESVQNRLLDFYVAGSAQAMSAYPIMPDELLTSDLKHPTVNPFSISLFMNFDLFENVINPFIYVYFL